MIFKQSLQRFLLFADLEVFLFPIDGLKQNSCNTCAGQLFSGIFKIELGQYLKIVFTSKCILHIYKINEIKSNVVLAKFLGSRLDPVMSL
jgi:hypothetical protein